MCAHTQMQTFPMVAYKSEFLESSPSYVPCLGCLILTVVNSDLLSSTCLFTRHKDSLWPNGHKGCILNDLTAKRFIGYFRYNCSISDKTAVVHLNEIYIKIIVYIAHKANQKYGKNWSYANNSSTTASIWPPTISDLTHRGRVTHVCVSKICHHWFRLIA